MKMISSATVVSALALLAPLSIGAQPFVINDECLNAIPITDSILPYFDSFDGVSASFNPSDPLASCGYSPTEGNTVWYKYTADSDGVLIADIPAPMDDRFFIMTLYRGSSCQNLVEVSCVFDYTPIYYPVVSGETYYIKTGDAEIDFYGPGVRNLTVAKDRNYFYVIDDVTNLKYSLLYDLFNGQYYNGPSNTIDYNQLANPSLSIAANFTFTSAPVRSVRLTVDNQPTSETRCDNTAPYTLFGDNNNDVIGSTFTLGNRQVTATAFSRRNCGGNVVGRLQQNFLVRGCQQVHFSLYDARNDKYIKNILNGTVLTNPPCDLNIGVVFKCGFTPEKVRFTLRRASNNALVTSQNDNIPPYFLFGDNGRGNILPGSIAPGTYTLSLNIDGVVEKPVTFTISGQCRRQPIVDTTFDVDLRIDGDEGTFISTFTLEQANLFQPVLNRLRSMIIGDKPEINTTGLPSPFFCGDFPPLIDDLYICTGLYELENDNDEFLGFLLESYVRESDGLPFAATILFDTKNFQAMFDSGLAGNYVLQQLIQTLGLGRQWSERGLAERTGPCSYNGTKAKAEFNALTGCASNIPLETTPFATLDELEFYDCIFWDQKCLKNEVLTHSLGQKKVSRVTLGSLEDIGYQVNYTTADPYGPNDVGVCAGCNGNRRGLKDTAPMPSCHQGGAFDRAVRKGKEMLRKLNANHLSKPESANMPKGVIYSGNQHLTVAYRIEDGTMCSAVVTSSGGEF